MNKSERRRRQRDAQRREERTQNRQAPFAVSGGSIGQPDPLTDQQRQEGDQGKIEHVAQRIRRESANPNWWMLAVTVGVGLISWGQWQTARDTLKLSTRAYVIGTDAKLFIPTKTGQASLSRLVPVYAEAEDNLVEGVRPLVEIQLTNTGNSPALRLRTGGTLTLRPTPPNTVIELIPPALVPVGSMLGNDRTQSMNIRTERPLTAADVEHLKGGMVLVAIGLAEYDDVFGQHHVTNFCFYYQTSEPTMRSCSANNGMD